MAGELEVPPGVAIVTRVPPRLAPLRRLRRLENVRLMSRSTASAPLGLPTALPSARKSLTIASNCAPSAVLPGYGFVTSTLEILRSVFRLEPER